jgi:hypothetical protein
MAILRAGVRVYASVRVLLSQYLICHGLVAAAGVIEVLATSFFFVAVVSIG